MSEPEKKPNIPEQPDDGDTIYSSEIEEHYEEPDDVEDQLQTQIPQGKGSKEKSSGKSGQSPEDASDAEEIDIEKTPMIGEFRLLRRLGRGGMGDVFLAEQTSLSRQVALKMLRKDRMKSETLLQRFKTEAMAAGHINHSNIVQVYLIGEADGYHFIAQEFVDGRNLKEHISKKGKLLAPVAIHIMKQVATALQKAAEAGIVHRDIKPENIMINRRGVVKVADFGLARLTQREDVNLTQVGMTMGTPTYMSPEQVHGQKVDPRSDIYSFGVSCYHMLAGSPPFFGETALAVAVKHLKDDPSPLTEKRPDLPATLCNMVHKMMQKEPAKRYQTAQQIIVDLRKISNDLQKGGEGNVTLTEFDTASRMSSDRSKKSFLFSTWKFILSVVLFLGIGFGIGWLFRTKDPFAAEIRTPPNLPEFTNAEQQWQHAFMLGTNKNAWKKVYELYPDSAEAITAKEQLGILYLKDGDFKMAREVFQNLESTGKTDRRSFAKGLAGRAIVESLEGQYSRSNLTISTELRQQNEYLEGPLQPWIRETIIRNQQKLKGEVQQDLLKIFSNPDDEQETDDT